VVIELTNNAKVCLFSNPLLPPCESKSKLFKTHTQICIVQQRLAVDNCWVKWEADEWAEPRTIRSKLLTVHPQPILMQFPTKFHTHGGESELGEESLVKLRLMSTAFIPQ